MTVQCPSCGARFRIDRSQAERSSGKIRCTKCQAGFEVKVPKVEKREEAGWGDHSAVEEKQVKKILVVDDAKFFREVVIDILQHLPMEILKASDGEEALRIAREERPALIILDLKLPKLDGYQLIGEIRSDPALKWTKILAMSSIYRQKGEVDKVLDAGADDFLNKSFRPDELLGLVGRLLEQ
ncbi:MAG: hypothetical protein C0616_06935 [Desulfuromonas sp.]|nr:MAG: hypothetical protein C0616_06935 [Desulfuromonas sp.]